MHDSVHIPFLKIITSNIGPSLSEMVNAANRDVALLLPGNITKQRDKGFSSGKNMGIGERFIPFFTMIIVSIFPTVVKNSHCNAINIFKKQDP